MAYLVTNNTFKPYTFDEMLQPISIYKEEFDKQSEDLGVLADSSSKLSGAISGEKSLELYNNNLSQLKQLSDDLYTNGLTTDTKRNINNLKSQYLTDMNRLANAASRRQAAIDAQSKEKGNIIHNDFTKTTTDDWLDNNTPISYSINADEVFKTSSDMAEAESKRFIKDIQPNIATILKRTGFNSGETQAIIQGIKQGREFTPEELGSYDVASYINSIVLDYKRNIYDNVVSMYGIDNPNISEEDRAKLGNTILNGIYAGNIYKEDISANPMAQFYKPKGSGTPNEDYSSLLNPRSIYTKDNIKNQLSSLYRKKVDGKYHRRTITFHGRKTPFTSSEISLLNDFAKKYNMPTQDINDTTNPKYYEWAEQVYNKIMQDDESTFNQVTTYDYPITSKEESDRISALFSSSMLDSKGHEAIFNPEKDSYESYPEAIDTSEIFPVDDKGNYTNRIIRVSSSSHGLTFLVQDKDNNTKEYMVPTIGNYNNSILNDYSTSKLYQKALTEDKYVEKGQLQDYPTYLTEEQKNIIRNQMLYKAQQYEKNAMMGTMRMIHKVHPKEESIDTTK